jgi:isopropylmalate/homocitrate/citramalate synthase
VALYDSSWTEGVMSVLSGLPKRVRVVEVGPRDGLQNEASDVPARAKIELIEHLAAAGLDTVESGAFVHPKAVPRMADTAEVLAGIHRREGVRYPVLVPNQRGLERALEAGVKEIAVFTAASDAFNQRNIRMTIAESLEVIALVTREARSAGMWVRGYISTCFGCPYQGAVSPAAVLEVVQRLDDLGIAEISLGDTIGVATPREVEPVIELILKHLPLDRLALHFHDTRGTALTNTLMALQMGCWIFDSSAGGLGGCPFAPGAAGNLATEDLLYFLHGLGIETGVDLEAVAQASRGIARHLDHPLTSKVYQAMNRAA